MLDDILSPIRKRLEQIRDERNLAANTAKRVGDALLSILSLFENGVFIRNDIPNKANEIITFVKGLLVGNGFGFAEDGTVTSSSINNSDIINTKNLTVTGKLTVFELEIERAKSVGGLLIVSPADFRVDAVESIVDGWRCYMLAEDETAGGAARKLRQMWQAGDQAFCQSVSLDTGAGGLRYYWRAVTSVSTANVMREDGKEYIFIDLSASDCDTSSTDAPAAGDNLMLLGNHELRDGDDNIVAAADEGRQGAEVLSAYRSIDAYLADKAPYKAQYWGIDDYDLTSHLKTYFARGKNHIVGDIEMTSVSTVDGKPLGETLKGLEDNIEAAKAQSDHQIVLWFGDETPTLANEPYTLWADDVERSEHVGDIYYNRSKTDETAGHAYEFKQSEDSGTFYWEEITDSDVLYALEMAAQARKDANDAQKEATEALNLVYGLSDDSLLTPAEKLTLAKEVNKIYYERHGTAGVDGLDKQADKVGVSRTAYDTAFDTLGKYLNKGIAWGGGEDETGALMLPAMLSGEEVENIDSGVFNDHWNVFYSSRTELINNIANSHIRCFAGIPKPPYKKGDIWVNASYPILVSEGEELVYDNDTLVCVTGRNIGEQFDISDWQPQQKYTTKIITKQFQTADKIAAIICGEKSIDDIQSMIENASDWQGLVTGLMGLRSDFNTQVQTINSTISTIQQSVTDGKNTVMGYVQSNFVQYVDNGEGGLKLFASYLDSEGQLVNTASMTLVASADGSKLLFDADDIMFSADNTYINGHLIIDSEGNVSLDNLTVNNAVVHGEIYAQQGTMNNMRLGSDEAEFYLIFDSDNDNNARIYHPISKSGLYIKDNSASLQLYGATCDCIVNSNGIRVYDNPTYHMATFELNQIGMGNEEGAFCMARCNKLASGEEQLDLMLFNLPTSPPVYKGYVYVDNGFLKIKT